jgi:hypothetical protein
VSFLSSVSIHNKATGTLKGGSPLLTTRKRFKIKISKRVQRG